MHTYRLKVSQIKDYGVAIMQQTTVDYAAHFLVLCVECGVSREYDCDHSNTDAGWFELD